MVQQRLSSEAEEFFPLSMPTDVSLHNQPEQPLVYVWIEDYREDYCSVAAWQVAATQPEDKDDDAYFGMADMGQQGLRAQAKEFVPSSMSTAVFLGPAAPVRAGPSCGEDSCAVGAVQVEARKSEVENDVVQCGMQTMQQKKVVKRLMNARLPMKRQGAEQQEVSCLPAEEWGLQALDAVEVPAQPRSLETKSLHILQADSADTSASEAPSGQCQSDFLPEKLSAVAQAPRWRLRTRSDESGVEVERMLQREPTAMNLALGFPESEAAVAEHNAYGIIEFRNSHMHVEKKHDPVVVRNSESSVEEQQVADVDIWASPAFTDVAHHGSEDSIPLQSRPTTSPAPSSVLGAPSQNVQPDGTLPFQVEFGVEYDRGWVKYKDPEGGEIWFHNEHTDDYFFAQYSRQWGWLPYESKSGQRWWWHDKRKIFFFEGVHLPWKFRLSRAGGHRQRPCWEIRPWPIGSLRQLVALNVHQGLEFFLSVASAPIGGSTMSIPSEVQGILAVFVCGCFVTLNLILSKLLQGWQWPYFFLAGLCSLLIVLGLQVVMLARQGVDAYHCQRKEIKWVLSRGLFGCGNNVLSVCAALAGAPMGSIGVLSSVNTVVAALLGRVVLGEPLGKLHILSVLFSMTGAVLISDPQSTVSAGAETGPGAYLGYVFALLSGVSLGCMFISARKSKSASPMVLTTSAMSFRCVVCWTLACVPAANDGRLQILADSPGFAILLFAALLIVLLVCNLTSSAGSQLCPAAISATVMTATNMSTGYAADILLFHKIPSLTTILGAAMMLLAVVTVAVARLPWRSSVPNAAEHEPDQTSRSTTSVGSQESLVSFVASEFAEQQDFASQVIRQRAVPASTLATATQLGRIGHGLAESLGGMQQVDLADCGSLVNLLLDEEVSIRLLRGSFLQKMHQDGKVWRRRQEMPDEAFVSALELRKWREDLPFRMKHRIIILSHVWETMEHPDPLGFQLGKMMTVPDIDSSWWFVDFMSLFQFYRDRPEQENSFREALAHMHVMYSHDDTWTMVLEDLTPQEQMDKCSRQEVEVFSCPEDQPQAGKVGPVRLQALHHNRRPYQQRGWCRAELEWSGTRSQVHIINCGSTVKYGGRAPLCPELFQQQVAAGSLHFTHRSTDARPVMEKQAEVFLAKAKSCKSLDLKSLPVTELMVLADALFYYEVLSHLSLANCNFTSECPEQAKGFSQALERSTSFSLYRTLRNVWLEQCCMDFAILEALSNWLSQLQSLEAIGLRQCGVQDHGARCLARKLKSNSLLRYIDLSGNCIEVLNLDSNRIENAGAVALAKAVTENPVVQKLLLSYNCIGASGARALATAAREGKSLKTLYLHGSPVAEACEDLAGALRAKPTLDFGQTSVDETAASFANGLTSNDSDATGMQGTGSEDSRDEGISVDLTSVDSLIDFLLHPAEPIRLVKGSYLQSLHWQGLTMPRRQDVPEDGFVSREELQKWKDWNGPHPDVQDEVKFRAEHPIVGLSHAWEALEHPDYAGFQLSLIVGFRHSDLPGTEMWWHFIDYMSTFQICQTPKQDYSFQVYMQHVHVMFAHDETYTLAIDELTPEAKRVAALGKSIKIRLPDVDGVQTVPVRDLVLKGIPPRERGWMQAEQLWSRARSSPSRYMMVNEASERRRGLSGKAPLMTTDARSVSKEVAGMKFAQPKDADAVTYILHQILEEKANNLRLLTLVKLPQSEMLALMAALPRYQALQRLHVTDSPMMEADVRELAAALGAPCLQHSLEQVVLCRNMLEDSGALALAPALGSCCRLHDLDLSGNGLGNRGAQAATSIVQTSQSLRSLRLNKNRVGDAGALSLAQSLQSRACLLQELSLKENFLGDAGAGHFAVALQSAPQLSMLDLEQNRFGRAGRKALHRALEGLLHAGRDIDFRPEELQVTGRH
ncbi:NLRC5, partial [Symbiodinium sp. KB8]